MYLQSLVVDIFPGLSLRDHKARGGLIPTDTVHVRVPEHLRDDFERFVNSPDEFVGHGLVAHGHILHGGHPAIGRDGRDCAEDRVGRKAGLLEYFELADECVSGVRPEVGETRVEDVVVAHVLIEGKHLPVRVRRVAAVRLQYAGVAGTVVQHGVVFAPLVVVGHRRWQLERQDADGDRYGNRFRATGEKLDAAVVDAGGRIFRDLHGNPELLELAGP